MSTAAIIFTECVFYVLLYLYRYAEMHPKDPRETAAVGKIVSEQHTLRLKRLIDETDGTVVLGGDADVPSRYIAPTIIKDVKAGDVTMKE